MQGFLFILFVMGVVLLLFGHALAGCLLMTPFGVLLAAAAIADLVGLVDLALRANRRRKRQRARR